jgi:hypothetical protein
MLSCENVCCLRLLTTSAGLAPPHLSLVRSLCIWAVSTNEKKDREVTEKINSNLQSMKEIDLEQ